MIRKPPEMPGKQGSTTGKSRGVFGHSSRTNRELNLLFTVSYKGIRNPETEPSMARQHAQSQPTWAAIKAKLASLDRLALIGLIQDLYAADRDNQVFLHARFGLGEDVLKPYKEALDRWLWPDVLRNQDASVAKAKQTISSYRKAVGAPAGLAELMVYYCETAAGFSSDIGLQDEDFFDAWSGCSNRLLK
jgi:hypothetical protein